MKKFSLLLIVIFLLTFVACGDDGESAQLNASDVLNAFIEASLPIGETEIYTEETDPNELLGRPDSYTSKVNFADTRLEQGENLTGGSIEVFAVQKDAETRKDYIESIFEAMPFMSEYIYIKGTMLLRLSYSLTPEQAQEYNKIFANLE